MSTNSGPFYRARYEFEEGSSASGIDFPGLSVDLKVTSIQEPQSYCTFKSAWQKVYGLGYALLVFFYEKCDDEMEEGVINLYTAR